MFRKPEKSYILNKVNVQSEILHAKNSRIIIVNIIVLSQITLKCFPNIVLGFVCIFKIPLA